MKRTGLVTLKNPPMRDWRAQRRGAIYCAPACGTGCTYAAFLHAQTAARKLCKRLGAGWTPRVWENLGWHYSAVSKCGRLKVHPHDYNRRVESYGAFLGEPNMGGRWAEHGKTPEAAIEATMKAAVTDLNGIGAMLTGFDEYLAPVRIARAPIKSRRQNRHPQKRKKKTSKPTR